MLRHRSTDPTRDRGQATLEYAGVVAVVALVLALGGSLVGAPSITNAVGRQMRRALCTVTGTSCASIELRPCVLKEGSKRGSVGATIAVVSIGRGMSLLRIERSDGTIDLTLLDEVSGGLAAMIGARGRVGLGERELDARGTVEAEITARLGGGTTWRVISKEKADDLEGRLKEVAAGKVADDLPGMRPIALAEKLLGIGSGKKLPEPYATTVEGKASAELTTALGSASDLVTQGSVLLGVQKRRDGTLRASFDVEGSAGAQLAGGVGVAGAKAGAGLIVLFDRHSRPTSVTVSAVGTMSAKLKLAKSVAKGKLADREGPTEVRVQATLDLTEAGNHVAALRAVLNGLRPGHAGELPEAIRAFAGGLERDAALDVSTYRSTSRDYGVGGAVGLDVSVGANAGYETSDTKLTGAWSRPPAGAWEQRGDCVQA